MKWNFRQVNSEKDIHFCKILFLCLYIAVSRFDLFPWPHENMKASRWQAELPLDVRLVPGRLIDFRGKPRRAARFPIWRFAVRDGDGGFQGPRLATLEVQADSEELLGQARKSDKIFAVCMMKLWKKWNKPKTKCKYKTNPTNKHLLRNWYTSFFCLPS